MNSLFQRPNLLVGGRFLMPYHLSGGTLSIDSGPWQLTFRPSTSIVGVHWQLRSVRDSTSTYVVPASLRAYAEFRADGSFGMDDGTNFLGGHYRTVEDRLDLTISDRFGRSVQPREWYLVPLPVIDEIVEKIRDGSIIHARYDPASASLVMANT